MNARLCGMCTAPIAHTENAEQSQGADRLATPLDRERFADLLYESAGLRATPLDRAMNARLCGMCTAPTAHTENCGTKP